MRLDKRIADQFGLSRRAALAAVRQGQVDVDGQSCLEPAQEVLPQAEVVYHANRPRAGTTARRLHVLYEDPQILIVNKPARLLTQPTPAQERDTLLERAGRYLARKHEQERPYVGIVHRLDQDTTGAILVVTKVRALRPFQAMFRAHAIERTYVAVVEGVPLPPSGRIDMAACERPRGRPARSDTRSVPGCSRGDPLPGAGNLRSDRQPGGMPARNGPNSPDPHSFGRDRSSDHWRSSLPAQDKDPGSLLPSIGRHFMPRA